MNFKIIDTSKNKGDNNISATTEITKSIIILKSQSFVSKLCAVAIRG